MKIIIVLMLLFIVWTLLSSFWFLVRDQGKGPRVVRRLSWRIALSMLLFGLIVLAVSQGWYTPGSGGPVRYPSSGQADP